MNAHAKDMVFIRTSSSQHPMPSWTSFNQQVSTINPEQTSMVYLPIIQAPAHELDTLSTVACVCCTWQNHCSRNIQTVGEAMYPKLMELKWSVDRYKDVLIPSLGGLHIGMNFLVILVLIPLRKWWQVKAMHDQWERINSNCHLKVIMRKNQCPCPTAGTLWPNGMFIFIYESMNI